MKKANDFLIRFCKVSIILMVPFITIIVFLQVVMRYIFLSPFSWVEELSRYLLIWISCLGVAVAMKEGLNISVTFLYEKLSDPIRFWVMILGNLIVIVFLMACVIEGFKLSISEWGQFCPALHIPMTFPLLAVPIGFGITAMLHWELFIETLRNIHPGLSDDKVRERVVNPRT